MNEHNTTGGDSGGEDAGQAEKRAEQRAVHTHDHDRVSWRRRDLLGGIATVGVSTGFAGCMGGPISRTFEAQLYGLPDGRIEQWGYGIADFRTITNERSKTVTGIEVDATVNSNVLRYSLDTPTTSDRPGRLGVLSTPKARVVGQSLNPVAKEPTRSLIRGESLDAIAEGGLAEILDLGPGAAMEWIRQPQPAGTTDGRLLGGEATVETFAGIGRSGGGLPHAILVTVARVDRSGDHVIVATGRDRPIALDEAGAVAGLFSPLEIDQTVEAFVETIPELVELGGDTITPVKRAPTLQPVAGFPEDVARLFAERIEVAETDSVFLAGPVPPGTRLTEPEPGATFRERFDDTPPVALTVPDDEGTYYVGVVDDMPGFKFVHPVRYAWIDVDSGQSTVVDASWWPQFFEGDERVTAQFDGPIDLDGLQFNWVKGGSCTPCEEEDESGTVNTGTGKDDAQNGIPDEFGGEEDDRFALVVDLGDTDTGYSDGIADEAAADADAVGAWLGSEGYRVQRISQYWDNPNPKIPVTDRTGDNPGLNEGFFDILREYRDLFEDRCEATGGETVEFFLYLNGHGFRVGVSIFDPTGTGIEERLPYGPRSAGKLSRYRDANVDALSVVLASFPDCVAVTVFVDACQSGNAVAPLRLIEGELRRLSVITAGGVDENVPTGEGPYDSATEDFMQGDGQDLDGDGTAGDLNDRIRSMTDQSGDVTPQVYPPDGPHGPLE